MLLRFLLVTAVASLGVDLPTWRQAATDVRANAAWCGQQIAALAQPAAAPTPAPEVCDTAPVAVEAPMPVGCDAFVEAPAEAPAVPAEMATLESEPTVVDPMPTGLAAFAAEPAPAPELTPVVAEAAPEPTPTPAPEPEPVVVAVDPDAGFQMVMTETVNHFVSDLAGGPVAPAETLIASVAEPTPAVAPVVPPAPELEPLPAPEAPAEDLYPGLAFELNRNADGLPEIWRTEPSPAILAAVTPAPAPTERSESEPPKTERLVAAVRLTGQALHAWMSLLQAPSVALDEAASLSR